MITASRAHVFAAAAFPLLALTGTDARTQTVPDPNQVVDHILEAYGGAERLRQVSAFRMEGRIDRPQGGHGVVIRISEGPERLKQLVHYSDRVEIRIVEDGEGWKGASPTAMQTARGPLLAAMRIQAARAFLPWMLDRSRELLRVVSSHGGHVILECDLAEGLRFRAFVDAETYRVFRSESVVVSGPMEIVFATDYSDFRMIDGVLFALHEETFASGVHTASTGFVRVVVNPSERERKLPIGG